MMTARPPRRLIAAAAFVALAAGLILAPAPNGADKAEARPQYVKPFGLLYQGDLGAGTIKKNRCDICHEKTQPKNKKIRNPYGAEMAKLLGENEKDQAVITKSLQDVADKQSCVSGKTYGDLIKDGKLPSDGCAPATEEGAVLLPIPDAAN